MNTIIRRFRREDLDSMILIWNDIVKDGIAFPQTEMLDRALADKFFSSQTHCAVAVLEEEIVGIYILHPNNVGRCAHICNASYAVKKGLRGKHIGEALVKDCMVEAKKCGFRILQFNAVVKTNAAALHLYKKLGFTALGIISQGFLMKNGDYEDIIPHYITL